MYLLINMLMIQHNQHFHFTERPPSDAKTKIHVRNSIPCGLINEYTYQFEIKSLQLFRLFFHSTCRYHLHTCRPEFYYECDWNGARIIVIVQQTKK